MLLSNNVSLSRQFSKTFLHDLIGRCGTHSEVTHTCRTVTGGEMARLIPGYPDFGIALVRPGQMERFSTRSLSL